MPLVGGRSNHAFCADVPDMDAARAFMVQEPFYSKDINLHRWRFGRVMDRFK
jgi:hypothetical protein